MKRREFLVLSAAALTLPNVARAALTYTPGLAEKHLAAGKVVFLDFKADWCSTCRAQERTINAIKAENPSYAEAISFINVDWDEFGRSELVKKLRVPRRSTLVVLYGDQELGRIVAETSQSKIKALMDTALAAAVS